VTAPEERERRSLGALLRFVRRKAGGAAAEYRYARRLALGGHDWSQPIRTMTFTALDCEMTGLDPARDEILSIGAVRIRGGRVTLAERFYQVFKPVEAVSPKEVILIHGLGPDEVSRGVPLADAIDRLLAFVGDSVVIGHFVAHDLRFLNAALAARGQRPLANPALDTRLLYGWSRRRAAPGGQGYESTALEALARELDLPRYPAHHAFYDALTTGLAFLKLLSAFEASGAVQFRALYREAGVY
jgi:DNA polymerase-3 subunit epsilon